MHIRRKDENATMTDFDYTALDQYATERDLVPFLTQVYDHEKEALLDFIASYGEGAAHD